MFVERVPERHRSPRRRARQSRRTPTMALLQISEPGQAPDPHQRRIAVGIDLGTTHSLVAAVRHGVAECLPDDAGPRDPAVGGALPRTAAAARSATTALAAQGDDAENTIVSAKRFMGRALADVAGHERLPYHFVDQPGMVGVQTRDGVKTAGRGLRRDPRDAALPRRGHLRRRRLRRGHHGAGVLRRRAAPGHQGRRAAGRPERAAPDQRADGGGDRLRPRRTASKASTRSTTWAAAPSTSRCCA